MKQMAGLGAMACALALWLAPLAAMAQAPGPCYARGTFYCTPSLAGTTPPDSCFGYGPLLELFDDGGHDDGAAGDGVYGAWVACNQGPGMLEFKIANADWSFDGPTSPLNPLINGRLFTAFPGEIVHFRLDLSATAPGWEPAFAFANDHAYPVGSTLELMGSGPELGDWTEGLIAEHVGTVWQKTVRIAGPGLYQYKFRVLGTWDVTNFGYHYNNNYGANGTFLVGEPDTEMLIQFDELTGRIRAIPSSDVAASGTGWGRLKVMYR
jgi:hypothetical protein